MKNLILAITSLLAINVIFGQAPSIRKSNTLSLENTQIASEYFSKIYGNSGNNTFVKAIVIQNNYYVIGKNGDKATVSKIDIMGNLIWNKETSSPATWRDLITNKDGNILLIGHFGNLDTQAKSLIGVLNPLTGNFISIKSYDFQINGRESLKSIYLNPNPFNSSFPYYISGLVTTSGNEDDVFLLNIDNNGNINFGKKYTSADDEFYLGITIDGRFGEMMLYGGRYSDGSQGTTVSIDKAGNVLSGRLFNTDLYFFCHLSNTNPTVGFNHILGGRNVSNNRARVVKVNGSAVVYNYDINQINTISHLYAIPGTQSFIAIGIGNFGGVNKSVLMHFTENGSLLTLNWAKVYETTESAMSEGFGSLVTNNKFLFLDTRTNHRNNLGNSDGFLTITEANFENCIDKNITLNITPIVDIFNEFAPTVTDVTIPPFSNEISTGLNYSDADICQLPCTVSFTYQLDKCGEVDFISQTNLSGNLNYTWTFGTNPQTNNTQQNPSHTYLSNGTYNVCVTVTSGATSCNVCQNVIVSNADAVAPNINCPNNIQLSNNNGQCYANITPQISVTDNCDPNPTCNCIMTGATSGVMPKNANVQCNVGVTTVTCRATDASGNVSQPCSFTVNIFDTQPPSIVCPPNITISCNQNEDDFMITGQAVATDNCPGVMMDHSDSFVGNVCSGTITRTWTATDASGAIASCLQLITKEDNSPPSFTCPPSNLNPIECTANPSLGMPSLILDNCNEKTFRTFSDDFSVTGCITTVTRTWTVSDQCNNSATCEQIILMQDTKAPVISGCGRKITVKGIRNPDGFCLGHATIIKPTFSDMCDTSLTITNSYNNMSNASGGYPVGQTIITWTAQDDCGLMVMCRDTVVVECESDASFCGWAAATCYSFNSNEPVGVLYNVSSTSTAPVGADWTGVGTIHPLMWTKAQIGDVFGICFDNSNNVYLAATDVYHLDAGAWLASTAGPAGYGGVYKTNLSNTNINTTIPFVSSFIANGLPILTSGSLVPNTGGLGNGIGNIAYDKFNNQFFITNLEDGRIYRLSSAGVLLSSYDPFNDDIPSNGICPNGEALWGIAVNKDPTTNVIKVYFARSKSAGNPNQIWSISLDVFGEFSLASSYSLLSNTYYDSSNEKLEIDNIMGTQNKITDIEFSNFGNIIIAERGDAHNANVFQYENIAGIYVLKNKLYVGASNTSQNSSAGGVDFGYIDATNSQNCEEIVWATGNLMQPSNLTSPGLVYGMEGISPAGNFYNLNNTTDLFIDFDGSYSTSQKLRIGDVDIYKCKRCTKDSTDCNQLSASVNQLSSGNDTTCCYSINLTNNVGPEVTKVCIGLIDSPLWGINTSTINSPGFNWSTIGSGMLCIENSNGIPAGTTSNVFEVCLTEMSELARDTQCLEISWCKGEKMIACRDTLKTNCGAQTLKDTCFNITNISAICTQESDYSYCVSMTVTNIGSYSAYGFVLSGLSATYSYGDCGCSGSVYGGNGWAFDWFSNPLLPGQSRIVCVRITSALPILDTTQLCFNGSIEGLRECCKRPFAICVNLEPCCNPCNDISIVSHKIENQDSCCYAIDLRYNCDYQYFNSVTLDVLNPDVHFGSYNVSASGWNLCPSSNSQHICASPGLGSISSGVLPSLVTFCLTDIDDPSEVPQFVQIGFNTLDSQGRDSIACDTVLRFECIDKKDPCVFITNEQIECIPDSNKYKITVTVQNLSNPNFTAGFLTLFPLAGISPNPIPLTPPLPNDGSSRTVTFCYTPPVFPDVDGKLVLVYKLTNLIGDSCCNGNQVLFDTLMLPECGPIPCGYICDDDDLSNFDVENQTLGALNAPPSGWYKEYNKPTIVADGCNGSSRSLQLAGVTRGYLGEGAGVRINGFTGPVNLLEKGKTYCIKFCAKVLFGLASTSGYLRIRATDGSPLSYGTCLYPSCEIVKDVILTNQNVWDEITVFYTPTQNYTNLVFSNQSISPLDVPSVIRIDALGINSAIPVYNDLTPPSITCPMNTTITDINSDCIIQYTIPVIPVSDDNGISTFQCYLDGSPVFAGSTHSVNNSIIHVVSCVAYDVCGNRDSCSYTVTVACDTSGICCGKFNYNAINPFGFGEQYGSGSMDFIDVNDDGKLDHIFWDYDPNTLQSGLFYKPNNGIPNNQFGSKIWFSNEGILPYNFDYNGDGKDDLFFWERGSLPGLIGGNIYYRENLGSGNFATKIPIFSVPLNYYDFKFAIGDINQDQIADLVTAHKPGGGSNTKKITYYEGIAGGAPSFMPGIPWIDLNIPIVQAVPELFIDDCTGLTDLYFANQSNLIKYSNLGGTVVSGNLPNFDIINPDLSLPYTSPKHWEFCVPRFVDLDHDFKSELVIDPATGEIILYYDCDSIPVSASCCKDSLIFVNTVNNSVLVGYDSKTCIGSVDISLLDPCIKIDKIDWGYGSPTIGALATGNLYTHDYTGNSGQKAIIITFSEYDSNGKKCWTLEVEKRIKPECNNQSCKCKSLKVYLTGSKLQGISNLIDCNDTIAIDCPTKTNVFVNAKLQCDPAGCGLNGITYKIYDAEGVLITSGSSSGNSIYNLQLLAGWFDPNGGTYSIVFEGYCGAEKCSCKIFINVPPCPKECLCNDNFTAEVKLGFQYNYLGNCKYTFTPRNLCPKDRVNWLYNSNNIGTTSGIGVLSYSMSNIGLNEVCMEVTRIDANGISCTAKYCRPFKHCNITTPPDDPCEEDEIENSDFRNASPGLMNEVGKADKWSLLRGEAYVIQEADSANHILLVSRKGNITDLHHNSCCLDENKEVILKEFTIDISKDSTAAIPPGTKLQIFAPKDVTVTDLSDMKAEIDLTNLTRSWKTFSITTFSDPNWKFDNMVLRLNNPELKDIFINIANPCIELMSVRTEDLKENSFSIYPNPTSGQLTIQFTSPVEEDITLKVFDVLGKEISRAIFYKGSNTHNFTIEEIAAIYILQLTDKKGNSFQRKVIKIE